MRLPISACMTIETALNGLLALNEEARIALEPIEGKVVALHIQGVSLTLCFRVLNGRIDVMGAYDGEVDATISGTPFALASLRHAKDAVMTGSVTITGDTRAARHFSTFTQQLGPDWEELLSQVTGDIVAGQIGQGVRVLGAWAERSLQALKRDVSEYLQEEVDVLAPMGEPARFSDDVDTLRSDVDRLAARIERLSTRLDERVTASKD